MHDPTTPENVVLRFLALMEERKLDAAQTMLADHFKMVFPGSVSPDSLAQLVEWAQGRYRFVRKTFDHVDVLQRIGGGAVVYCAGTLRGEWLDGTPFEGIRFIDRFEVEGGQIVHQSVWNDMAVHAAARQ